MFCVLLAAHETTLSRILHHPSGLEVGAGAHERCHQNRATAILLEKEMGNNTWDSSSTVILLHKLLVGLVINRHSDRQTTCGTHQLLLAVWIKPIWFRTCMLGLPLFGNGSHSKQATIMPSVLDNRENVHKSSLDPVTRAGNAAHISYAANEIAYCYWRTI